MIFKNLLEFDGQCRKVSLAGGGQNLRLRKGQCLRFFLRGQLADRL